MRATSRPLQSLAVLVAGAVIGSSIVLLAPAASATTPVPATPTGLPTAIEAAQPYVGQATCDPVAKPGVAAFRDLVLATYPTTTNLGIVRDCGIGGQSEHKEGRAWDWGVSASNTSDVARVNALFGWMLATDSNGNTKAIARRLGLMYVIWNSRILGMYDTQGWHTYTGPDPHTGHVHFSFGWNGARKTTSFWDRTVAPVDYGPSGSPAPTPAPAPAPPVVPTRDPANLAVLRSYGSQTLQQGSTGTAVKVLQTALHIPADGAYGPQSASAVSQFESTQKLTADGVFDSVEWPVLFPAPIDPFGRLDLVRRGPGGLVVRGWTIDADQTGPVSMSYAVDDGPAQLVTADQLRNDVATAYPDQGGGHGFSLLLDVPDGPHTVCATGVNAAGTPGADALLGCQGVTVSHSPVGLVETVATRLGTSTVTGWALDADAVAPVAVALSVDNGPKTQLTANGPRADVAALWPGYGAAHGWVTALTLPEGTHTLCGTALNAPGAPGGPTDGRGSDQAIGCVTASVVHRPVGLLETARQEPTGVRVRGWALDPDATTAVSTQLVIDGIARAASPAALTRLDLPVTWSANGTAHGFTTVVPLPAGTHRICLSAANAPGTPGTTASLSCRSITVRHAPLGLLTVGRPLPGTGVTLSGWAIDPDTTRPVTVSVSLDGVRRPAVTATRASSPSSLAQPGYGSLHGFAVSLPLTPGHHSVCVALANVTGTPGTATALGCRRLLVAAPALANLAIVRTFGATTLRPGSRGPAVSALQRGLLLAADGGYGALTTSAVRDFERDQHLATDGVFHPSSWRLLLPRPVVPFGVLDALTRVPGGVAVTGWTADTDVTGAIQARLMADAGPAVTTTAAATRAGLSRSYPEIGDQHAFRAVLPLTAGPHRICGIAVNAAGTQGTDATLGCRTITVSASPLGLVHNPVIRPGAVSITGWALDPDTATPISVQVLLDGALMVTTRAATVTAGLGAAHPGYGDGHGWAATVTATPGLHRVCVKALNATGTPGVTTVLRCSTVTTG